MEWEREGRERERNCAVKTKHRPETKEHREKQERVKKRDVRTHTVSSLNPSTPPPFSFFRMVETTDGREGAIALR
jgi:hypothetical protein